MKYLPILALLLAAPAQAQVYVTDHRTHYALGHELPLLPGVNTRVALHAGFDPYWTFGGSVLPTELLHPQRYFRPVFTTSAGWRRGRIFFDTSAGVRLKIGTRAYVDITTGPAASFVFDITS